jgi:hypothetical protein
MSAESKQRPFIQKKKRITFKSEEAEVFLDQLNKYHEAVVVMHLMTNHRRIERTKNLRISTKCKLIKRSKSSFIIHLPIALNQRNLSKEQSKARSEGIPIFLRKAEKI